MNWKPNTCLTLSIISVHPAVVITQPRLHSYTLSQSVPLSQEVIPRLFANPSGWRTKVNSSILVTRGGCREREARETRDCVTLLYPTCYAKRRESGNHQAKWKSSANILIGRHSREIKVVPTDGHRATACNIFGTFILHVIVSSKKLGEVSLNLECGLLSLKWKSKCN